MKRGILSITFGLLAVAMASGNSIGFHLTEADLVVAGTLHKEEADSNGFDLYRLDGPEVVRGELPEGSFGILFANHVCYHVHLEDHGRMLLFLRRMDSNPGVSYSGPLYMAMASPLSALCLCGDEGDFLLDAARLQASVLDAEPERQAEVMAGLVRAALGPGMPRFLRSTLVDAVRTRGSLALLDNLDRARLLGRFRETAPNSELQRCLLDALGAVRPAGLEEELISTVRGPSGSFHRDQIAAILAGSKEEGVTAALIADFEKIDEATRANVLYVLGNMGRARGVDTIREVMWTKLKGVQEAAAAALTADRTTKAIGALGELALGAYDARGGTAAVLGLARINTRESRKILDQVRKAGHLQIAVRRSAAECLDRLTK